MTLNKHSFSLVEMAIVLVLFALISMMVLFNRSLLDHIAIKTELDLLYNRCCFLQRCAMAQGMPQEMVFYPETNSYAYKNHHHTLPNNVTFGVTDGVKGPPAYPTKPIQSPITFEHNRLTFSADGIANAGAIYLLSRTKNYLYALTSPVAQSSHMRKYCYYNRRWSTLT